MESPPLAATRATTFLGRTRTRARLTSMRPVIAAPRNLRVAGVTAHTVALEWITPRLPTLQQEPVHQHQVTFLLDGVPIKVTVPGGNPNAVLGTGEMDPLPPAS